MTEYKKFVIPKRKGAARTTKNIMTKEETEEEISKAGLFLISQNDVEPSHSEGRYEFYDHVDVLKLLSAYKKEALSNIMGEIEKERIKAMSP